MLTTLLLILASLSLLVLALLMRRQKDRKHLKKHPNLSRHSPKQRSEHEQPFHSVSIVNQGRPCEHAAGLQGKRFLSRQAPSIPLAQCSVSKCQCRYQHHHDRRQAGSDRRVAFGVTRDLYGAFGEENRRQRPKGRRATDH
ncbi:MAG: hypothetical protein ACRDBI_04040 [Shewanella sp.]